MDEERVAVPEVDRLVTVIGVHGGQPLISHGQVVAVSPTSLVLRLPPQPEDALLEKAAITLMYTLGDISYTLRCSWGDRLPSDQVLLRMAGPPRRGERREFIRAELDLDAGIYPVPAHQANPEGVREMALGLRSDPRSTHLERLRVDLSGSGVRVPRKTPLEKDRSVIIVMELQVDAPGAGTGRVAVPARVVRSRPDGTGAFDIAFRFEALAPVEGDLIHAAVFAARMADLGATL
ncbi:MAG: PilZ domain-containing protein [Deltaproteobacteria bacterium]|nr:PilZ domain-containing protein [Deltaproteobacteria bacterium]